jgi:hypothetical protein
MRNYTLWLDDIRTPNNIDNVIVARNSTDAINYVISNGFPGCMYLDHDLGGNDTTMVFLKAITPFICNGTIKIPKGFSYTIISANPVGAKNISSYINSLMKVFS